MDSRASTFLSGLLHLAALGLLGLSSFPRQPVPERVSGMEMELIDIEHAMPLPDAVLSKSEASDASASPSSVEQSPSPRLAPETAAPPSEIRAPAASQPSVPIAPAKAAAAVALAPAATVRPAEPSAQLSRAENPAQPVRTVSAATPAPAVAPLPRRPALDTRGLAGMIAATNGKPVPTRLNSAAIGSAIGKAAPRGTAGLTVRQRTNLEDMVRAQVTPCWNPPVAEEGYGHVTVTLRMALERSGNVLGTPAITGIHGTSAANGAYARALAGSVRRAVLRCAPLRLPPELFDAWSNIELNFDPRDVS